jgi:hypothetical protein
MPVLRRSLFFCAALCVLSTVSAVAATSEVGNCGTFTPQYNSIQAAVNSSSAGDTIYVCPGTYTEQVFISQSLTLQGLANSSGSALATIKVPVNGMVLSTSFQGTDVAAQIYIFGGANVTINDLTVDGGGNNINTCGTDLIGIYFQNASGKVAHSSVLNEVLPSGFTGCQSGEGIFVESGGGNSTVTVSNTLVENYQKNGITGNEVGTTLTVNNNTIVGQGPTTGAAENGVQIAFGAKGSITSNTVANDIWAPDTNTDPGDAASGILVYASKGVSITANQVTNTQFGIALAGDSVNGKANASVVSQNIVGSTHIFDAIDVCGNNNTVSSNTINGADESGIHLDDTCGGTGNGNSVTNNTVNLSCAGVLTGTGTSGNSLTGNTYFNVGNQTLAGDMCTLTAPLAFALQSSAKSARATLRPARH